MDTVVDNLGEGFSLGSLETVAGDWSEEVVVTVDCLGGMTILLAEPSSVRLRCDGDLLAEVTMSGRSGTKTPSSLIVTDP